MAKGVEGGANEFWDLDDMTEPTYIGGEVVDPGATPAQREGGFFGGRDCRDLARRIHASFDEAIRPKSE